MMHLKFFRYLKGSGWAILFLLGLVFVSCQDDDKAVPDIASVSFTAETLTLDQNKTEALLVNVTLSRPASEAGTIGIAVGAESTADPVDYTIDPAPTDGMITLDVAAGEASVHFMISPRNRTTDGKTVVFKLSSAEGGVTLGKTAQTATVTIKKDTSGGTSIIPSVTSLDDFGSVDNGKTSGPKTFTVLGSGLTQDISVEASDNFQVSLDNQSFADSLGIGFSTANSSAVTVYVRFAPASGSNKAITGLIQLSSAGASEKEITVSGTESGNVVQDLILADNFDYGTTAGDLTSVTDSWKNYSGTTQPVQYVVPGLSFSGYGASGVGGAVTMQNGKGSREDVTVGFSSQTSGVIYMAQLVKVSKASASASGDFFLSLRNSDGDYLNRIYAKDDGKGNLQLGVVKNRSGGGDIVYAPKIFTYNTTYLIVVKYDFTTTVSSLYVISGAIPQTEPQDADVFTDTGDDPDSFDNIIIRQSSDDIAATLDGIRVAKTWKDALGL